MLHLIGDRVEVRTETLAPSEGWAERTTLKVWVRNEQYKARVPGFDSDSRCLNQRQRGNVAGDRVEVRVYTLAQSPSQADVEVSNARPSNFGF